MAGIIEVKDQGVLRIYDADNSNYVDIVVPSTVSSNRTITIPDATFTIPTSEFTSSTITGQSAETSVADDDLVVISDTSASGALKKMTKANFVSGAGITVADQWRVTANITANADPISANLEQIDTAGQGTLGSAMTVSSGIFTFPSTGIYLVELTGAGQTVGSGDNISLEIYVTTNNSSYTAVAYSAGGDGGQRNQALKTSTLIDVTDTSNVKVKFAADSIASGSLFYGSSTRNDTFFTFIRMGDT